MYTQSRKKFETAGLWCIVPATAGAYGHEILVHLGLISSYVYEAEALCLMSIAAVVTFVCMILSS